MRRSQYRRATKGPKWLTGKRRLIAAAATIVAFGAIVTVTQVSDASTKRSTDRALAACDRIQAPRSSKLSSETKKGTYKQGKVTQHSDDGASDVPSTQTLRDRCRRWVMQNAGNNTGGGKPQPSQSGNTNAGGGQNGGGQTGGGQTGGGQNNGGAQTPPPGAGLDILARDCSKSQLQEHDGFQNGNRCVTTEFGEVGTEQNNPTLLITEHPDQVNVGEAFTIKVSTRNIIRDRFLAAGQGGYYVESSILQNGIVRGHFHTACRVLQSTNAAPDPAPAPDFFVATEDSKGSATPDTVDINVPGLKTAGTQQCSSWLGDGSHRIPMMQRANQTPGFDSFRLEVGNGGGNGGDQQQGGQQQGGQQQGGDQQQGGQQAGDQQQGGDQQDGQDQQAGDQQQQGQQQQQNGRRRG
ncbi:Pecanex-like protein 1 [Actinoplanes sp. NPDC049265]|uniref:Pecanex-like protein 1 n=1 Tax=Actinoplanes sp. NPDC049265 TaxID=3363902 RepID=UPI0037104827